MAVAVKPQLKFKDGDRVRILEREPGNPDPKALIYYPFYANLSGKIIKAYEDGSISLDVDRGSLPEEIRLRHEASEASMREKWLGGIGEVERERLSEKHKNFSLRYTLLVSANDAELDDSPPPKIKRSKPAPAIAAPVTATTKPTTATEVDVPVVPRKTDAELEAAEEAYLRSKQFNGGK